MALENVALLATLAIPNDPQTRARWAELTSPGGVPLSLADRYEALDPTRHITVAVDRSRLVTDVRIRPRWTQHIRPDGFPAALYSTYVAAVQRALVVEFAHRKAHPPNALAASPVDPTSLPLDEWVAVMRSRLNATDDEYDRIRRQDQGTPPADVIDVRSPLGYLTLRLRPAARCGSAEIPEPWTTPRTSCWLNLLVRWRKCL